MHYINTALCDPQVALLMAQTYLGPRCFIPKSMLPAKYDYHRPLTHRELSSGAPDQTALLTSNDEGSAPSAELGGAVGGDEETGEGSVECVICMNPVDLTRPLARMVAPCSHCFHTPCLQRWMEVKMECPTCRRALPQP